MCSNATSNSANSINKMICQTLAVTLYERTNCESFRPLTLDSNDFSSVSIIDIILLYLWYMILKFEHEKICSLIIKNYIFLLKNAWIDSYGIMDYERIYLIVIKYMRYCSLLYVRVQMFLGYQLFEMNRTR